MFQFWYRVLKKWRFRLVGLLFFSDVGSSGMVARYNPFKRALHSVDREGLYGLPLTSGY